MRTAYRVETVRSAERELMARLPDGTLMDRAAAGLAATCAKLLRRTYGARIALLVGTGDNGGDALYAGARLARRGAAVTAVLLAPERAHPGGLAALRAAGGRLLPADGTGDGPASDSTGHGHPPDGARGAGGRQDPRAVLAGADLVLDGIVGIGGRGGLRESAVPLVEAAEAGNALRVAVDLPSGVDVDTGEVRGAAVRAHLTVTFGTYKPGLLVDPAREHAGDVRLVDIGLGPLLPPDPELVALTDAGVAARLPRPSAESDKYRRGVVGVVAGSSRYPGAAVLAVAGALNGGAGAVRYAGVAADAVVERYPETLVSHGLPSAAGRVQSWAIGPGIGAGQLARRALREVLESDVPVLVDADGLGLLDRERVAARTAPTVLTPHAGEAARLLGRERREVEAARLATVRELAAEFRATVLLKGSTTLVAAPDGGPVWANPTGTGWLATAGSGDVLTGLVGSLLAAGLDPVGAAAVGAYLHGRAGRRVPVPPTAGAVAAALPDAWRSVREPGTPGAARAADAGAR